MSLKCLLIIEICLCCAPIGMSLGHLLKTRKRTFHTTVSENKFHLLHSPLKLYFIKMHVIIILPSITNVFKSLQNFPNKFFVSVLPFDGVISQQLLHCCNSRLD